MQQYCCKTCCGLNCTQFFKNKGLAPTFQRRVFELTNLNIMNNNLKTENIVPKNLFPKPKPIDWTKYIAPKKAVFVKLNSVKTIQLLEKIYK